MSDKAEIKSGDTVKLKSGGPLMTAGKAVPPISDDEVITCHWFVGEERRRAKFPLVALIKTDAVSPP